MYISVIPTIIGITEMKNTLFKKKLANYPYFTSAIYPALGTSKKTLYNQVDKWTKTGEVIRLRKGLFTLNNEDRRIGLSRRLIANVLYSPSYVSLESALSFYGMIPDAVFTTTSVTSKKTQRFKNAFGEFTYRSIKKNAFFGFVVVKDEFGSDCFIATPEKALLDFIYLNVSAKTKIDSSFFDGSMRLQNAEHLNIKKMMKMAKQMESKKLEATIKKLIEWRKK